MPRQAPKEDDDDLSTIAPEEDAYLENFALDDPLEEEEAAPTDEPTGRESSFGLSAILSGKPSTKP